MSIRVSWRQGQGANGNGRKVWRVKPSRASGHEDEDKDNVVKVKDEKYIEQTLPLYKYNNAIISSSSASASGNCKQKKTLTFVRIMRFVLAVLIGGFIVNIKNRFSSASTAADHSSTSAQTKVKTATAYASSIVTDHELPQDWQTFGFQQIRNHFKCDTFDRVLKPPSMKKWQMILDAYNREVDSSYKFDQIVLPTEGYVFDEVGHQHGEGAPPFHARSTKMGTHRGLFATWDIRKGDLIHDGSHSDVVFPDAMAYRRFVFALPQRAACDMIDWTWTQRLEKDGPMKIMTAINISAMLSSGLTITDSDQANVMPESSTSQLYYATRDIKSGEEILYSTLGDRRNFAATDLGM